MNGSNLDASIEAIVRRAVRAELVDSGVLRDEVRAGVGAVAPTRADPAREEVTTSEAAELVGVKRETILDWRKKGWLTATRRTKEFHFLAEDVRACARKRLGPRKVVNLEARAKSILSKVSDGGPK